jgi:acylphosphatase
LHDACSNVLVERERRHVIVHGFVQGVGFRFAVERAARTRRVSGWVRNRADGTVEAVFEGDPADVDALVEFCRRGPRGAGVDRIDVAEESAAGLAGFHVAS